MHEEQLAFQLIGERRIALYPQVESAGKRF
jgi:hypothetical protein